MIFEWVNELVILAKFQLNSCSSIEYSMQCVYQKFCPLCLCPLLSLLEPDLFIPPPHTFSHVTTNNFFKPSFDAWSPIIGYDVDLNLVIYLMDCCRSWPKVGENRPPLQHHSICFQQAQASGLGSSTLFSISRICMQSPCSRKLVHLKLTLTTTFQQDSSHIQPLLAQIEGMFVIFNSWA